MVLDSSYGVSSNPINNQWAQERDFVKEFVRKSELGKNENVEVAVVNYGFNAEIASVCGNLNSKVKFNSFIDTLQKKNGGTAINMALLKAREAFQGCKRLNVVPIIILLTNGKESVENDTNFRQQIEELVKSEALLFVGAIGPLINASDIQRMSRYEINEHVYFSNKYANSFWDLLAITYEDLTVLQTICESK